MNDAHGIGRQWNPISLLALVALLALLALLTPSAAMAQGTSGFGPFTPTQHVYDETGTSLSPDQLADLERRVAALAPLGADVVIDVRALDADTDDTQNQVEELRQTWSDATGADRDGVIAILINRNPVDPGDARIGIDVGRTFNDADALPAGEREAIIEDELVPPLRDGDVHGSLTAALDRMASSITNGPPTTAFQRFSRNASDGWLPWAALVAAVGGALGAVPLFRRRQVSRAQAGPPTLDRPSGGLSPAVAGALVAGAPQATALPATLLDLAARGALVIEPEQEAGRFSKPSIQVRLRRGGEVRDEVEAAVWRELENLASGDVVPSKQLQELSGKTKGPFAAIRAQLDANGWDNPAAGRDRGALYGIGAVAFLLAIGALIVGGNGGHWLGAGIATALLAMVAVAAFVMGASYPTLSVAGQEAAAPWRAYRDGLKRAGKDEAIALDLDAALPDIVALNLGTSMDKRLKAAGSSGQTLRAFSGATGMRDGATIASFPFWVAFNSSVTSTSASGGTVSGGSAGGGGSSAGST